MRNEEAGSRMQDTGYSQLATGNRQLATAY